MIYLVPVPKTRRCTWGSTPEILGDLQLLNINLRTSKGSSPFRISKGCSLPPSAGKTSLVRHSFPSDSLRESFFRQLAECGQAVKREKGTQHRAPRFIPFFPGGITFANATPRIFRQGPTRWPRPSPLFGRLYERAASQTDQALRLL